MHSKLVSRRCAAAFAGALLLSGCGGPAPGEGMEHEPMREPLPRVVSASEALQNPDLPSVDPGTMQTAEIDRVVPPGARCSFRYTAESPPILSAAIEGAGGRGVTKIHGLLVPLSAQADSFEALAQGGVFAADGMTLHVMPDGEASVSELQAGESRRAADLIFEIEQGLKVGYRGWYSCSSA